MCLIHGDGFDFPPAAVTSGPRRSFEAEEMAAANRRATGLELTEIEEDDARWGADSRILAGERQSAAAWIDAKRGDRVSPLV